VGEVTKKVCVVGAGNWGKNHIKTLHEIGALGGVVDIDESRLLAVSDQYDRASVYQNVEDALERSFDGYIVSTPAATHFDITKKVIENRHHVLVEKPLALNVEDAEKLRTLADEYGVNLMAGHLLLFHPAIVAIKKLIIDGAIGDLQYLYSNRLNLGVVRTEENILWSFAPHDISIFQHIINDFPVDIVSRGGAFLRSNIHDTTMTILRYHNNIVAHVFVSWLHPFKEHRLVIIGSDGMITFEDSSYEKSLYYYDKAVDFVDGQHIASDVEREKIDYPSNMPLTEELIYFTNHLDGKTLKIATANHAIEVLRILETASQSLQL
jgi:predicted dehydrogenase|tara:strand:- start:4047 stop:5015 length:969 start_codon:yes stop_codon:yes gene_type:complete